MTSVRKDFFIMEFNVRNINRLREIAFQNITSCVLDNPREEKSFKEYKNEEWQKYCRVSISMYSY